MTGVATLTSYVSSATGSALACLDVTDDRGGRHSTRIYLSLNVKPIGENVRIAVAQ